MLLLELKSMANLWKSKQIVLSSLFFLKMLYIFMSTSWNNSRRVRNRWKAFCGMIHAFSCFRLTMNNVPFNAIRSNKVHVETMGATLYPHYLISASWHFNQLIQPWFWWPYGTKNFLAYPPTFLSMMLWPIFKN